jgi:predicted DNA-binding antitoxin AbrB/MazE fold protein
MRKYTVIATLTIQAGAMVGLTKAQAAARGHALKPVDVDRKGDGVFEVLSPVQFKAGEQIATDTELNKQLAAQLESAEDTAARNKREAKSKEQAAHFAEIEAKAKQWDDVQQELLALRKFVADIEALPKELFDKVKAELEKKA